jgi:hypothetical protein
MDISQLSRQERVNLVPLLLGNHVTATILKAGKLELVGWGREFDTDCSTFTLYVNGEALATNCVFYEDALDESFMYIHPDHHDDFKYIEDTLASDGYDWQECVVASLDKN